MTGAGTEGEAGAVGLAAERLTWEVEDRFLEDVRGGLGHKAEVGWQHRQKDPPQQNPGRGSHGERHQCVGRQSHRKWWQGHLWKSPWCYAKDLMLLPGGSREPSKILQARADGPVWPCS